jgi:hypothetical protein
MGHVWEEERNTSTYRVLVVNPERKIPPVNLGADGGIILKFI